MNGISDIVRAITPMNFPTMVYSQGCGPFKKLCSDIIHFVRCNPTTSIISKHDVSDMEHMRPIIDLRSLAFSWRGHMNASLDSVAVQEDTAQFFLAYLTCGGIARPSTISLPEFPDFNSF